MLTRLLHTPVFFLFSQLLYRLTDSSFQTCSRILPDLLRFSARSCFKSVATLVNRVKFIVFYQISDRIICQIHVLPATIPKLILPEPGNLLNPSLGKRQKIIIIVRLLTRHGGSGCSFLCVIYFRFVINPTDEHVVSHPWKFSRLRTERRGQILSKDKNNKRKVVSSKRTHVQTQVDSPV